MKTYTLTRLKQLRHDRGWSQSTLASMAGLSLRTVQRAEKGEPTAVESCKALASVFDLTSYLSLTDDANPFHAGVLAQERTPFKEKSRGPLTFEPFTVMMAWLMTMLLWANAIGAPKAISEGKWEGVMLSPGMTMMALLITGFFGVLLWREFHYRTNDPFRVKGFILPRRSKKSRNGLGFYLRSYPIACDDMLIGTHFESNTLIKHDHVPSRNHMLFFGEEGAGVPQAMMGQAYAMLCQHRSGLILLDSREYYMVYQLYAMLKAIGREQDLIDTTLQETQAWSRETWAAYRTSRRVIVALVEKGEEALCAQATEAFMTDLQENLEPSSGLRLIKEDARPFLWTNDAYIENVHDFVSDMKASYLTQRAAIMLRITDAQAFLSLDKVDDVIAAFPHRYVMVMHNPLVVEALYAKLSASGMGINTDPLNVVGYPAGCATYFYRDKAWDDLFLLYLDYPIPVNADGVVTMPDSKREARPECEAGAA